MPRFPTLIAAFAALSLALAPGLAEARAGSGSSFGSRGSMTWSAPPATRTAPYSAAPMQRSMTPNNPSPGYAAPGYGSSGYRQRSPFMSGLMGGLIGAGIGGLLFGHGFWHGGLGFGGFFGFLIQVFLLVWVVRWLLRLFRGSSNGPVFASGPNIFARNGAPPPGGMPPGGMPPGGMPPGGMPMGGAGVGAPAQVAIGPADYEAFEQLLQAIQAAWTAHDLNGLRAMVSPEMLSYFAEQLADQESRGVRNEVRDVRLLQGDLAQAWHESNRDYATVAMRFSMIDVTRDRGGRIVDGSPTEHVTATELWTFLRAGGGGHWLLSAIQQTR
jgi:predicted lipid-binding transport protein (Tim44 family)